MKKYLLTTFASMIITAACTPEPGPEPGPTPPPQKIELTMNASTVDQVVHGVERAQSEVYSTATLDITGNMIVDSVANSKTLPDAFAAAAEIKNFTINKKGTVVAADQDSPWVYSGWNAYKIPIGSPKPFVASRADSVLFANAGYELNIKQPANIITTMVINLTPDQAANEFDAMVAVVPMDAPFVVRHNNHPITVRSAETLSRYAHPSALVPNAKGWSDTDPKFAALYDIPQWSADTLLFTANRIWASEKLGQKTEMRFSEWHGDGGYIQIILGGATSKNQHKGISDSGIEQIYTVVYTDMLPRVPAQGPAPTIVRYDFNINQNILVPNDPAIISALKDPITSSADQQYNYWVIITALEKYGVMAENLRFFTPIEWNTYPRLGPSGKVPLGRGEGR